MKAAAEEFARAMGKRGAPARAQTRAERPVLWAEVLWRYVPVALTAAVFAHLWVFGLEPALRERGRLVAAHEGIARDQAALRATYADLEAARLALEDPIYQERRRRWRWERAEGRAADVEPVGDAASAPTDLRAVALAIAKAHGERRGAAGALGTGNANADSSAPPALDGPADPGEPPPPVSASGSPGPAPLSNASRPIEPSAPGGESGPGAVAPEAVAPEAAASGPLTRSRVR